MLVDRNTKQSVRILYVLVVHAWHDIKAVVDSVTDAHYSVVVARECPSKCEIRQARFTFHLFLIGLTLVDYIHYIFACESAV